MVSDLGGRDALSTGQIQLIRRCAEISLQCEIMERQAADGQLLDLTSYGMLTRHLTRALRALGLKREPRDVSPTLRDYLAARHEQINAEKDAEE
jgi:hypothetical protein